MTNKASYIKQRKWTDKLPSTFYQREDVVLIAKELLGKILVTNFNQQLTAGRIVETEAYNGLFDKAAHSYNNRRTVRTEVMFSEGGIAYVYLCYGLHQMFNVVTDKSGIPSVVLIRALEPIEGINVMLERRNKTSFDFTLTKGPGNVCKAMGIDLKYSGRTLQSNEIFIASDNTTYGEDNIGITKRIGVDFAAEDALLPYRYFLKGNHFVSGKEK